MENAAFVITPFSKKELHTKSQKCQRIRKSVLIGGNRNAAKHLSKPESQPPEPTCPLLPGLRRSGEWKLSRQEVQ